MLYGMSRITEQVCRPAQPEDGQILPWSHAQVPAKQRIKVAPVNACMVCQPLYADLFLKMILDINKSGFHIDIVHAVIPDQLCLLNIADQL